MIKGVIFDIGGVLAADVWESLFLEPESELASRFNVDQEKADIVGRTLWDEFSRNTRFATLSWREQEQSYWREVSTQLSIPYDYEVFEKITEKYIRPNPGMSVLIKRLVTNHITLAICSNNTEFWFERQMRKLNIKEYFNPDRIILSNRIGASKGETTRKMFLKVSESLRLERNECLFIDDRSENIAKAVEYGFTAILFPRNCEVGAQYLTQIFTQIGVLK